MLTVRNASIGAAALGPAIGALPYWVFFVFDVASRDPVPGLVSVLKAIAISIFYIPIVLIAAYLSAAVPAAIAGAGYGYLIKLRPHIGQLKPVRMACASTIAAAVCALWALTFGQLAVIEFVGDIIWALIGCGAFAGAVLAFFFPRQDSRNAAA